jgi:hypothetical protein
MFFTRLVKLSVKSSKDNTGTPMFGHIRDTISKNGRKITLAFNNA